MDVNGDHSKSCYGSLLWECSIEGEELKMAKIAEESTNKTIQMSSKRKLNSLRN